MKLKKVTIFITREFEGEKQLLLFKHPHAGIQIPAGTIEEGETIEQAALRETFEETNLSNLKVIGEIGYMVKKLQADKHIVTKTSKISSRPNEVSFKWATLRRGISVEFNGRSSDGYKLVTYKEYDNLENPMYITYQITGWIREENISKYVTRYFYHLQAQDNVADAWENCADNHVFEFFWAPINDIPNIIPSQLEWLSYVRENLNYKF